MITYLLYRYKVLKEGNPLHGFTSFYTMAIDALIIALIALTIYKNI